MSQHLCYQSSSYQKEFPDNKPYNFACHLPGRRLDRLLTVGLHRVVLGLKEIVQDDVILALETNLGTHDVQTRFNNSLINHVELIYLKKGQEGRVSYELYNHQQIPTTGDNLLRPSFKLFNLESQTFFPVKFLSIHAVTSTVTSPSKMQLIVSSNSTEFGKNSPDNFIISLKNGIDLNSLKKWQMRLVTARFSSSFYNILKDDSFRIVVQKVTLERDVEDMNLDDLFAEDLEQGFEDEAVKSVLLQPGHYPSIDSLAANLTATFAQERLPIECKTKKRIQIVDHNEKVIYEQDHDMARNYVNLLNVMVGITNDPEIKFSRTDYQKKPQEAVNKIFRKKNVFFSCKLTDKLIFHSQAGKDIQYFLNLSESIKLLCGFSQGDIVLKFGESVMGDNPADIWRFYPAEVYICCDALASSQIGQVLMPMLVNIPLNTTTPLVTYEAKQLLPGVQLTTFRFHHLQFYFCDSEGKHLHLDTTHATWLQVIIETT